MMAPTTRVDVAAPLALLALASVVPPSHASESLAAFAAFSSDGDAVERARDVLDRLETLPQIETIPLWLFVMTLSEMLPLFPSQPAALTSGIVFGAKEGAAMVVAANMTAATLAFLAARGAGRALAEKVVKEETGGGGEADETDGGTRRTRSRESGRSCARTSRTRRRRGRRRSSRCTASRRTRSAPATTSSAWSARFGWRPTSSGRSWARSRTRSSTRARARTVARCSTAARPSRRCSRTFAPSSRATWRSGRRGRWRWARDGGGVLGEATGATTRRRRGLGVTNERTNGTERTNEGRARECTVASMSSISR